MLFLKYSPVALARHTQLTHIEYGFKVNNWPRVQLGYEKDVLEGFRKRENVAKGEKERGRREKGEKDTSRRDPLNMFTWIAMVERAIEQFEQKNLDFDQSLAVVTMIGVAYVLLLRGIEVRNLLEIDVEQEEGAWQVLVNRDKTKIGFETLVIAYSGIPLEPYKSMCRLVCKLLAVYKLEQARRRARAAGSSPARSWLFYRTTKEGERRQWRGGEFSSRVSAEALEYHQPFVKGHSLREGGAWLMLLSDFPIETVMKKGGWKSTAVLDYLADWPFMTNEEDWKASIISRAEACTRGLELLERHY